MPTTNVGSGSGARNRGAICGGRGRRFSVLQRARARVIPGLDAGRAIERGSPTFDWNHESESAKTALDADPSRVERLAASSPRSHGHVGASRAGASRQYHRHRGTHPEDGGNPVCYLAGRLRLRSETPYRGGRDGIGSRVFWAPTGPRFRKASGLSNIGCPEVVIALWGLRATAHSVCRRHLAFAFATRRRTSTPAPLSANSRLSQLVVRLTDRFPARPAQDPGRNRKTLPLTRSPLHSRPTGNRVTRLHVPACALSCQATEVKTQTSTAINMQLELASFLGRSAKRVVDLTSKEKEVVVVGWTLDYRRSSFVPHVLRFDHTICFVCG